MNDVLADAVHDLKRSLRADVCSVHLADAASGDCVLRATDGLPPSAIGSVHFAPGEGLVGTVFASGQPLRIDAAEGDPRYRHIAAFGETVYRSFLGVPIVEDGHTLGVLSVRQIGPRTFTDAEVDLLARAATKLASLVSTRTPVSAPGMHAEPGRGRSWPGIAAAPGICVGDAVAPLPAADLEAVADRSCEDPAREEDLFRRAVSEVRAAVRDSGHRLASAMPSEAHALFRVYAALLDDDQLFAGAIERIRDGAWAPGALRAAVAELTAAFAAMEDPYLRARGEDIRGLARRVLLRLQSADATPRSYPERTVLVGDEISIARIADVPLGQLVGIVSTRGSPHSHAALLARALHIPAVMSVMGATLDMLAGRQLLVDGEHGRVMIEPDALALQDMQRTQRAQRTRTSRLEALRDRPAVTLDGTAVMLQANVGLAADTSAALACGASGVGLYRSEFAFMLSESFPSEDEQAAVYRQVLEAIAPAPVTMRTLDVGSDKELPYFPVREDNPALGWRGIRLTLDHPGVLATQMRAMLKAAVGLDNLSLLLPMVSAVDEVDQAREILDRALQELQREGHQVTRPELGVMLEVPAALYQLDALAKRCDFFSLGTNDLTQYLLAVDRNNPRVASRHDALHPAVLRALQMTVEQCMRLGKPLSVCGDMAGDPLAARLLVAMGVRCLSLAPPHLPAVKAAIRSISLAEARSQLERALQQETAAAVRESLEPATPARTAAPDGSTSRAVQ